MKKILNPLLLALFLFLVILFGYKQLMQPSVAHSKLDQAISSEKHVPAKEDHSQKIPLELLNDAIKDYIMSNPEVILSALEGLHNKKINESAEHAALFLKDHLKEVETVENPPLLGNPDGDVTVILFYDYNCSYCKKAHQVEKELLDKDPGVKIILRPSPILGETSVYAAKVILAVQSVAPDYLAQVHNDLMTLKTINQDTVKSLLKNYDIDYPSIENEINSYAIKQALNKNFDFVKSLGIKGTPSYIVNGHFAPGMISLDKFKNIILQLRAIEKKQEAPAESN